MKFTATTLLALLAATQGAEEVSHTAKFVYTDTKICSEFSHGLCMSFATKKEHMMLSRSRHMSFEVEPLENSLDAVRIYTNKDGEKYCLIPKIEQHLNYMTLDLEVCGQSEEELVLSIEEKHADKFVLKVKQTTELSEVTKAEEFCLSGTYKNKIVHKKSSLKSGNYVALATCTESDTAQSLEAIDYNTKQITSSLREEAEPRFGRYCLQEKPDLCLGVSLTNGTVLEDNKLIQVKNLTKNTDKGLYDMKLQWYRDLENDRIANAAVLDYCLKADYNLTLGLNRLGQEFTDDALSLSGCSSEEDERFVFNAVEGTNYMEIKASEDDACATVVRCVKYGENDFCSQYNSFNVKEEGELEQGAYVRLKSCDSTNNIAQRWVFEPDFLATNPPTNTITAAPTSAETVYPTNFPTMSPVEVTNSPTSSPTEIVTAAPTLANEPKEDETPTVEVNSADTSIGLTIGLVLVGVLCLAIILIGFLYVRRKSEEEDEAEEDPEAGTAEAETVEVDEADPEVPAEEATSPTTGDNENESFIARV